MNDSDLLIHIVLLKNNDSYYKNYVERERDSSLDSDSDDFMGD